MFTVGSNISIKRLKEPVQESCLNECLQENEIVVITQLKNEGAIKITSRQRGFSYAVQYKPTIYDDVTLTFSGKAK